MKSIALSSIFIFGLALFLYSPLLTESVDRGLGESVAFASFPLELSKDSFLEKGKLTHWDHLTGAGNPLSSNPLQQHYYISFIFSLLAKNAILGFRHSVFFHIICAGFLFYSLIRLFGGKIIAALYCVFILFSSLIFHYHIVSGVTPEIINYVWYPLLLFAIFKFFHELDWRYSLIIGFSFAMLVLGGGLHFISFNAIILVIGFIYFPLVKLILKEWTLKKGLFFTLTGGVLCLLTTIGLSAVKLLPLLQQLPFVSRSPAPELVLSEGRLVELDGIKQLMQKLLQTNSGLEISIFILITAIAALILRPNRVTCFLSLITVVVFWTNCGKRAWFDLYELFWHIIPGLKTNSGCYKIMPLGYMTVFLLSALGVDSLLKLLKARVQLTIRSIIIFGILALLTYGYVRNVGPKARRTVSLSRLFLSSKKIKTDLRGSEVLASSAPSITDLYKDLRGETEEEIINQFLGKLAKQEGMYSFRIWSGAWGMVCSIYAEAYQYQLINYALHTCVPKFYKGICDDPAIHDLKRELKYIGILNGKYLVLVKGLFENEMLFKIENSPLLQPIASSTSNHYIILKNTLAQERCFFPEHKVILIGKDHLNEYQSWEAKNLIDTYDLDPLKIGIVRGPSPCLDEYSLDDLLQFDGVILSDYQTKESKQGKKIIETLKNQDKILTYNVEPESFSNIEGYVDFSRRLYFYHKPKFKLDAKSENKLYAIIAPRLEHSPYPTCKILGYDNHQILIAVETYNKHTLLGISEIYSPLWKAKVDGKETEMMMLDGLIRGVIIDQPGKHIVKLYFKSKALGTGKVISILSFLGFIIALSQRSSFPKKGKPFQKGKDSQSQNTKES